MNLAVRPGRLQINGRRIDLVGFALLLVLAEEAARVGHFDRIEVVGVEPEDRNARIGAKRLGADVVFDYLPALLRDDLHMRIKKHVAAVADDGRKGRNVVGVVDDFAELALRRVLDLVAARAADGEGRR